MRVDGSRSTYRQRGVVTTRVRSPGLRGGSGGGHRSRSPRCRVFQSGSPLPRPEWASGLQEGAERGKKLLGRRESAGKDLTRSCRKRIAGAALLEYSVDTIKKRVSTRLAVSRAPSRLALPTVTCAGLEGMGWEAGARGRRGGRSGT